MKPRHLLWLHNLAAALEDIEQRYPVAVRRLEEVLPGFPGKTPGNGDPPGGKGATTGMTSTERLADQAYAGRLPELDDHARLAQFPADLTRLVHELLDAAGHAAAHVGLPSYRRDPAGRLGWARWAVGQLIDGAAVVEFDTAGAAALARLRRLIEDRHGPVSWWGTGPRKPGQPRQVLSELADDLTEMWCRSCLRVGVREPRYRGDLCRWCYEFHGGQGFIPPADIIVARSEGKRITMAMVAPHRATRAGKKSRKKSRKKARR